MSLLFKFTAHVNAGNDISIAHRCVNLFMRISRSTYFAATLNFGGKFPKIARLVSYDAKFHATVNTTVLLVQTAAVMFLSRFGRQKVSYRDCQEFLDIQGGVHSQKTVGHVKIKAVYLILYSPGIFLLVLSLFVQQTKI